MAAGGDAGSESPWKTTLAGAVTVCLIIVFVLFVIYLLMHRDEPDILWTRSVYLLGGLEAVTFAAVGWLFGREVHREQAQAAEKRAGEAEGQLEQARGETAAASERAAVEHEKGTNFATVVRLKGAQPAVGTLGGPATQGNPHLRELADLAAELYPDSHG